MQKTSHILVNEQTNKLSHKIKSFSKNVFVFYEVRGNMLSSIYNPIDCNRFFKRSRKYLLSNALTCKTPDDNPINK